MEVKEERSLEVTSCFDTFPEEEAGWVKEGACPTPQGASLASCWNILPGGREVSTQEGAERKGRGTQQGGLQGTSLGNEGTEGQLWGGPV